MSEKYFVALIENPSHPFNTFLIGEWQGHKDEQTVLLTNVVKMLEIPDQKTGAIHLNFMHDPFFSTDSLVEVPRHRFLMSRLLDSEKDARMLTQINASYTHFRAKRAGLITNSAAVPIPPALQKVLK
jgi:hypothetical protein